MAKQSLSIFCHKHKCRDLISCSGLRQKEESSHHHSRLSWGEKGEKSRKRKKSHPVQSTSFLKFFPWQYTSAKKSLLFKSFSIYFKFPYFNKSNRDLLPSQLLLFPFVFVRENSAPLMSPFSLHRITGAATENCNLLLRKQNWFSMQQKGSTFVLGGFGNTLIGDVLFSFYELFTKMQSPVWEICVALLLVKFQVVAIFL